MFAANLLSVDVHLGFGVHVVYICKLNVHENKLINLGDNELVA